MKWAEIQDRYAGGNRTANVVIPVVSFSRANNPPPKLTNMILLSHPDDCSRIARAHVKKMPDQALFLGDGVLSTTDNTSWRDQRAHFIEAFLPNASLSSVYPINLKRAIRSTEELKQLVAGSSVSERSISVEGSTLSNSGGVDGVVVDMTEFLLHETMAQLQLSLFGLPEEFMNDTNKKLRGAFDAITEATGITSGGDGRFLDMKRVIKNATYAAGWLGNYIGEAMDGTKIGVQEVMEEHPPVAGGVAAVPVQGPLSARIADGDNPIPNAATFVFAGHDTTANTMSWLLFEVAQQPLLQRKLQMEVDTLWEKTDNGNSIDYKDLGPSLPLLGRCLMETLRKWPVVPNGTFRETVCEDYVTGLDGSKVRVPKGTYIQITNWMRHRSKELWGDDVMSFNPMRDFTDVELSMIRNTAGYNPASPRFSPFTYGPRDCMGRNFAQMEMRLILAMLIRNFNFELAGSSAAFNPETFQGINRGTMGPQDLDTPPGSAPSLGLQMKLTARRASAKL